MAAAVVVVRGAERHQDGRDDVVDEVEEGGEEEAQVLAQQRKALLGLQAENGCSYATS